MFFITTQPIPLFVCGLCAEDRSCTNYPADFPIFIVWYFGHKIFINKGKIQILYIQICIKNVNLSCSYIVSLYRDLHVKKIDIVLKDGHNHPAPLNNRNAPFQILQGSDRSYFELILKTPQYFVVLLFENSKSQKKKSNCVYFYWSWNLSFSTNSSHKAGYHDLHKNSITWRLPKDT